MPSEDAADSHGGSAGSAGGRGPAGLTQADLTVDLEVIQAYEGDHPEVFGSVWFENGPSLCVGLTRLEPHAAELVALLVHPEAVQVRQVLWTARELEAVSDELVELMLSGPLVRRISTGRERVDVDLRAGSSELAARLRAEYADKVHVVDAGEDPAPPPAGGPGPTATADRPELQLRVRAALDVLVGGDLGRGQLRITNRSDEVQHLETDQPLHGCLLGPDGTVTGSYIGMSTGTGLTVVLRPGDSHDVEYVVGTETSGYRVTTPGRHELVVVLPLHDNTGDDKPRPTVRLVSPPVPVTVTAPPGAGSTKSST